LIHVIQDSYSLKKYVKAFGDFLTWRRLEKIFLVC